MKDTTLNFAVIGLGSIADLHIKSILELSQCALVAVSSSNIDRAKSAGDKYGVPYYSDYHEMLNRPDVDIVDICTYSGNHLEPALAAAQAFKHVIVEKPLEVTLSRAQRMIEACRKADTKLACIFQNRFSSDYQKLELAVRAGKLGKLLLGNAYIKWYRDEAYYKSRHWRGTWKGDGGAALINQGIHTIDLLQNLMGPVTSVFGKTKTMVHDIEGNDIGLAILSFKNGALGTIEGSTATIPGYPERLEIYGEKGSAILEAGKIIAWNVPGEEQVTLFNSKPGSGASDPGSINASLHKIQIQDMVEAVLNGREPVVNGEEGLKALQIIKAIQSSSKSNKEVTFI